MINLISKLPPHWAFRRLGWPKLYPFSLVLSVSYRCNSRCRTCGVWRKSADDMTLDEWRRVFHNLGRTPFYLTFTGGEPYLRADFADLVIAAYEVCRPAVITIPTNGLLSERIAAATARICAACPGSEIGLNLSLDGLGEEHDRIRGVPGNWERALGTWQALKARQPEHPNLVLSVHTVISRFNVAHFPEIYEGLQTLEPDSYITEVAEERVELDTVGWEITPSAAAYAPVADFLSAAARRRAARGLARITQSFRAQYYQLAKRVLQEQRQVIPCYAGWASGHIAPDGDVWTCCVRAQPVGNLRETGYDLAPIWFGEEMARLRRSIAAGECACPMANASYANMLLHPPTLARVARDVLL
ncbi:MAG: radical SAM protein [Chloroflexi bacterium]|nr:radical SAM protein [Chloroflexota bacterium]